MNQIYWKNAQDRYSSWDLNYGLWCKLTEIKRQHRRFYEAIDPHIRRSTYLLLIHKNKSS